MSAVEIHETGNPVFPYHVSSPCMSLAEAQAKAVRIADIRHDGFLIDPHPEQTRLLTAWEMEHADGAFCGSASSQTLLAPQPAPELPPAIAALAEAQMADDPHVGSLKAGEVGRDEEE